MMCVREKERMDAGLHEAALKGDVAYLLLEKNAHILEKATDFSETPLHVAALFGHVAFAKEILSRKLELARLLDSKLSSPLHLASARGHKKMVEELLAIDTNMCLVRDQDGRIPLHLAAINGHEEVVKMLVDKQRTATRVFTGRREPILHFCVNHSRFDSVKWLLECVEEGEDNEFVKMKDDDRNTILHLAVAKKHVKLTKYLLDKTKMKTEVVEVNALNVNGLTALDVLLNNLDESDDDTKLEEILRANAGSVNVESSSLDNWTIQQRSAKKNRWKEHALWLKETRGTLMLVATLILTITFHAEISPPSGVWQDDYKNLAEASPLSYSTAPESILASPPSTTASPPSRTAGQSIWADKNEEGFLSFAVFNTVAFIASLCIILLLISGFPLRRRIFMWAMMIIIWIAVSSLIVTYGQAFLTVTTINILSNLKQFLQTGKLDRPIWFIGWFILVVLLFAGHLFRLIMKLTKKIVVLTYRLRDTKVGQLLLTGIKKVRKLSMAVIKKLGNRLWPPSTNANNVVV